MKDYVKHINRPSGESCGGANNKTYQAKDSQLPVFPELLAPAGTLAAFKAALAAGADAIYCGTDAFNARRKADNLTLETLAQACDMAHIAGARVYLTTNILIHDNEISDAMRLVHDAWLAGVDAFIVQDWGLMRCIRNQWPEIELHLSTQANVGDHDGVLFAQSQGCRRVTLSRELTFSEIAQCREPGVDLEIFSHGALCVCYSGQCLVSSFQRGRSANRGLCRQPCRLPYELLDSTGAPVANTPGTRLISPRDNRTLFDLPGLVAAGAGSLKIEGRMKAPDYVAAVVQSYRQALDTLKRVWPELMSAVPEGSLPDSEDPQHRRIWQDVLKRWRQLLPQESDRTLRRAFNRDFTSEYLYGKADMQLMSYERGNNRGQLVGSVTASRGRWATIALTDVAGEGDLLEIRDPDIFEDYVTATVPQDARANSLIQVRLPRPMRPGCAVRLIRNESAMTQAREFETRGWPRKRPVAMTVQACLGKPFLVQARAQTADMHPCLEHEVYTDPALTRGEAHGNTVEPARSVAVSKEDVLEHVGRMGSSAFVPAGWDIELDAGVGMGFSQMHHIRAEALQELHAHLLSPWHDRAQSFTPAPFSVGEPPHVHTPCFDAGWASLDMTSSRNASICALVATPAQADAAKAAGASRIYALADDLVFRPASSVPDPDRPASIQADAALQTDLALQTDCRHEAWDAGVIPLLPEIPHARDYERVAGLLKQGRTVATGTVSGLHRARARGCTVELWGTTELHNAWSLYALKQAGTDFIWLSPELDLLGIGQICGQVDVGCGVVIMGYQRQMTMRHCVLQSMGPCSHICAQCRRRLELYTLKDEFGRTLQVSSDIFGRSRLWSTSPLDATPHMGELIRAGVSRFMVDARLMNSDTTAQAVRHACQSLRAVQEGRSPAPRLDRHSSGHLFSRIG